MAKSSKPPDILVVDDNLQNLKLLIALLDARGYLARPINNGALALRVAQTTTPDLILLDIDMPEMDGYAVCKNLKENPITRDVPVIFLSVYQDINEKLRAFQAGGVDYITKPFLAEEVFARIEKHLSIIFLQKELEAKNELLRMEAADKESVEAELWTLAQAVNCSGSSILITNLEGEIEFVNKAFSSATGYSEEEVIGKNPRILNSGETEAYIYTEMWATITQGNVWRGDLFNRKKNGELSWDYTIISPITDKDGNMTYYVAIRDDVTSRKEKEKHHAYLAMHDSLTKLPNRAFFNERMCHAIKLAKRNKWKVAIFFIDLNDFKEINDRFGHSVGDDALVEFGERLQACVRESDTVARLGGDEFAYIIEKPTDNQYLPIVARKLIKNLLAPGALKGCWLQG